MSRPWLWVDDLRPPPDWNWEWAGTYDQAVKRLRRGTVTKLSLDHDLGQYSRTGYDVAVWLERQVFTDPDFTPPTTLLCHSDNPPGKANILAAYRAIRGGGSS